MTPEKVTSNPDVPATIAVAGAGWMAYVFASLDAIATEHSIPQPRNGHQPRRSDRC
jgi:hypothetical protein